MKFTINPHTWYEINWQHIVKCYDQREGEYTKWEHADNRFLDKDEAYKYLESLVKDNKVKNVTFSTVNQIKD